MTRLTSLLRRAAERDSELGQSHHGSSPVALECLRDARSLLGALGQRRANSTRDARERYSAQLLGIDLAAASTINWMLYLSKRAKAGHQPMWRYVKAPKRTKVVLDSLLVSLVNNILGIRALAVGGLTAPARSIVRTQQELSLILVAITVEERFFTNYLDWMDHPDQNKGWSKVRPKEAMRAIDRFLAASGMDSDAVAHFDKWRKETYSNLSGFDHGHPGAMVAAAYNWNDAGGAAIGGAADKSLEALLDLTLWSLTEFLSLFSHGLFSLHRCRSDGSELGKHVLLSTKFLQAYTHQLFDEQQTHSA